jgi:hypothetical protein
VRNTVLAVGLFMVASSLDARAFESKRCGCSFEVPLGWRVVANPKAKIKSSGRHQKPRIEECAFGLRPEIWPPRDEPAEELGPYAIEIRLTRQLFREAARDAFFERLDELRKDRNDPDYKPMGPGDPEWQPDAQPSAAWTVTGRLGVPYDAYWIRSDNWFGVKGASQIGLHRPRGEPTGLFPAYRAVLSTGRWRTATFLADNPFTGREFDAVVHSFRFR